MHSFSTYSGKLWSILLVLVHVHCGSLFNSKFVCLFCIFIFIVLNMGFRKWCILRVYCVLHLCVCGLRAYHWAHGFFFLFGSLILHTIFYCKKNIAHYMKCLVLWNMCVEREKCILIIYTPVILKIVNT